MHEDNQKKISRGERFAAYICEIISSNKAKTAALKKADNPRLEYQSWEIFNRFGIDLTKRYERAVFGLIAAAMAKAKVVTDGKLGIGRAIAKCYEKGNRSDQAKTKLRRLTACDSVEELQIVLRPLLQLILSKTGNSLKFSKLLNELLKFGWDSESIKACWAQDFYYQEPEKEENIDDTIDC